MAFMNLLQSKFTGQMGQVVGSKWKNRNVIKSSIFSKAPPTAKQTDNVRAFEALNRISGVLAKHAWKYLGLKDKNMLRHNAVASWLKPAIQNHIFEPELIAEVIPFTGDMVSASLSRDPATGTQYAYFGTYTGYVPETGTRQIIIVCNGRGQVNFYLDRPVSFDKVILPTPWLPEDYYYLMSFLVTGTERGYNLWSYSVREGPNMQYSTDEQLTGDIWIDGKPIYIRTSTGTQNITAPNPNNITLQGDIETLIESGGMWQAWNGGSGNNINLSIGQPFFNTASPNDLTWYSIVTLSQTGQAVFRAFAKTYSFTNLPYRVWIKYTKTS
jgi:hypothetical protein